jgi:hypothetical protein
MEFHPSSRSVPKQTQIDNELVRMVLETGTAMVIVIGTSYASRLDNSNKMPALHSKTLTDGESNIFQAAPDIYVALHIIFTTLYCTLHATFSPHALYQSI